MPARRFAILAIFVLGVAPMAAPASAGPVYKDTERFSEARRAARPHGHARPIEVVPEAPPRAPATGSPGYVGSDYGLGKPAFTGLGSRPDWGRGGD